MFVVKGDELVPMTELPYETESVLQGLLADYPALLAGDVESGSGHRWILVRREAPLPDQVDAGGRWSVDHLFLDEEAVPTLVEVKRSTDTRIRREVVGQMLDYAANAVVHWPVKDLIAQFQARCEAHDLDPEEELRMLLADGGETSADEFWSRVETNLQAGKIRLVFVADHIPRELVRVIEYLNGQMNPTEVIGIEVRRFKAGDVTTLAPRVVGRTAEAAQRKEVRAGQPHVATWDEYKARLSPGNYEVAVRLYELMKRAVEAEKLAYFENLRPNHFSFMRAGDYGVIGCDLKVAIPCKLWIKIQAPPEVLGYENPWGGLKATFRDDYRQWEWHIPTLADVPSDLQEILKLAVENQPQSDAMPKYQPPAA